MRVLLRSIVGLSVLFAGGGALASAPTSPQSIALLFSFDIHAKGAYPVPGLTLDSNKALWGVLTVQHGGSLSERAPGVLFKVNGLDTAAGSGTTGISAVDIPPRAGSATYYALSFDPNNGTGGGLFLGTSLGDTSKVAGRPRRGAIFQFDPLRGTAGGKLVGEGFAVLADFDDGGLVGFDGSFGGIGFARLNGTTTYLVGAARAGTQGDSMGIYSFPYSTRPTAGSFLKSSVAGVNTFMSPPVEDPISSDWVDFPGVEGLSSTTADTFGVQGCAGNGCPGNTDFYTNARTGTQAQFGTSYSAAPDVQTIGIVALANVTAQNPISSDYLWIAGNALVWAQADTVNNSGSVPPSTSNANVLIAHVFSTSQAGGSGADGSWPMGGLVVDPNDGSSLSPNNNAIYYGTTEFGGDNGTGTVYCVIPGTDGTLTYHKLADFGVPGSGGPTHPRGELVAVPDDSGGTWLYGSSVTGGAYNDGTVFELKAGACNAEVTGLVVRPPHAAAARPLSPAAQQALRNPLLYVGAEKMFKAAGFPVTSDGP